MYNYTIYKNVGFDLDSRPISPLPEAGNDAGDPNRPISQERDTPEPPVANPDLDMDDLDNAEGGAESDNESDLSEVDEANFDDFDASKVALDNERPMVGIDEDVAKTLKASKRKRAEGEGKKPKEGKREKKKRPRRDSDEDPDGMEIDGKRVRKPKRVEGDKEGRIERRNEERQHQNPKMMKILHRKRGDAGLWIRLWMLRLRIQIREEERRTKWYVYISS